MASGVLHLGSQAGLSTLERLVSLIRRDVPPAVDIYHQLLGAGVAELLEWEAFAHLAREADVAAGVLRAALAGSESGVNVLLYGAAENLLRLARHLAATRTSLTLDEMAAELALGRRTAERMRHTLQAMFPQLDYWDDDARVRRWRLPGSALVGVVESTAEAIAAVETAARECEVHGEADRAALLREASTTLRAVVRPDALRRAETDIAALAEAEGIAMRPGPRPLLAPGLLPILRRAILGTQPVVVRYAAPGAEEPPTRILCPYGILYGGRGWLVAHVDELRQMRLWRLDRLVSADLLDRGFPRREDFSLSAYAAQSFGVFQEEPIDVVLRFTPEAADDASRWLFHPWQSTTCEPHGSLPVRFRAGGIQEMCWHLFTWGTAVTVIEPEELRLSLAELAATGAVQHGAQPQQPHPRQVTSEASYQASSMRDSLSPRRIACPLPLGYGGDTTANRFSRVQDFRFPWGSSRGLQSPELQHRDRRNTERTAHIAATVCTFPDLPALPASLRKRETSSIPGACRACRSKVGV